MLVIILVAIACGLVYLYLTREQNYWKGRNVDFKKPNLLFGNIFPLILGSESPGRYFGRLYKEFDGPYFGFFAFSKPWLAVKDPKLIKRILLEDNEMFLDRIIISDENIDPILGNSLIGIRTPHWKILRNALTPLFTTGRLREVLQKLIESSGNLNDYINAHSDKNLEMQQVAEKYTTDIITTFLLGISENSFVHENEEIKEARLKLHRRSFTKTIIALSYFFAQFLVRMFKPRFIDPEGAGILKRTCNNIIEKRENSKMEGNDLIDVLIKFKNAKTNEYSFNTDEKSLGDHVVTLFVAGYEGTSSAVAFVLHELCINEQIQQRLRHEILEIIDKHRTLSYDAIKEMKYLHMVLEEILRKYPVIPFISRQSLVDYRIPETGLVIEKGTPIMVSPLGLHFDPKYFLNPEVFDPERFSELNRKKIIDGAYVPFGIGPRNCLGERFALLALKVVTIQIIRNFEIQRSADTRDQLNFGRSGLLFADPGVFVTFKKLLTDETLTSRKG